MASLYQKYRPSTLAEVLGQPKAVKVCERLIANGLGGKSIMFSGVKGCGKTTLAKILAASFADSDFILETANLSAATLDEWEKDMRYAAWGKGGRVFLVNEVHGLSAAVQRRLDQLLENLPAHCLFLATTTWDGQETMFDGIDGSPFLERFLQIRLTNQGLADVIAPYCMAIAEKEGLGGKPLEAYKKAAQEGKNSFRHVFQKIESGEMLAA